MPLTSTKATTLKTGTHLIRDSDNKTFIVSKFLDIGSHGGYVLLPTNGTSSIIRSENPINLEINDIIKQFSSI